MFQDYLLVLKWFLEGAKDLGMEYIIIGVECTMLLRLSFLS